MTIAYINSLTDTTYASASALAAVNTATYTNGTVVEVTNLGAFKLNMSSTLAANNTTVIAATTGNWELFPSATSSATNVNMVALQGSLNTNIIDPSRIPFGSNNGNPNNIAAANNLTLVPGMSVFNITGTTQINLINSTGFSTYSTVILLFASTPTVKYNQSASGANAPIILNGAADYVSVALSTLSLIWDGTQWREIGRGLV